MNINYSKLNYIFYKTYTIICSPYFLIFRTNTANYYCEKYLMFVIKFLGSLKGKLHENSTI